MAQEAAQEAPQEQPQEQQPQQAASPFLEALKTLLGQFKASEKGFDFSIQFSPDLELPFEEFEELTKGFDSTNYVEMGKVTFADLISVIAERQVEPSRCRRDQKRVSITFRFSDDGRTTLINYIHGKRETVTGKCS
jgi:hypothetical protein